uniref:G protein-coupled receptor n=1 Tax=Ditylenchus dipsaci TaxID=166011 RepID=A0A915CY91_9BILA
MKTYRSFLLSYTFWDLLFTFGLAVLVKPELISPTMAYINGLGRHLGPSGGNISIAYCVFCGAGIILVQDNALLYRLVAVQPNKIYMHYFLHPVTVVLHNAAHSAFEFGLAILAYYCFPAPEELPKILANYPHILENVRNGSVVFSIKLSSYALVYTLSRNSRNFSKKTYKMHKQLTILLIIQLTAPVIFVIVPLSIQIAGILFEHEFSETGTQIGVLILSLYASFNSILTIFFVTPYRTFTLSWIIWLLSRLLCKKPKINFKSSPVF